MTKKDINNLKLSYNLEVKKNNKRYDTVNINIYNHNDYKVSNLECWCSLSSYSQKYLLDLNTINYKEIKPNGNVVYELGYWSDRARVFSKLDVLFHLKELQN